LEDHGWSGISWDATPGNRSHYARIGKHVRTRPETVHGACIVPARRGRFARPNHARTVNPATADITEPDRIPSFAESSAGGGSASSATSSDIVNPMPVSSAAPATRGHGSL